jgi:hypothetical protein
VEVPVWALERWGVVEVYDFGGDWGVEKGV